MAVKPLRHALRVITWPRCGRYLIPLTSAITHHSLPPLQIRVSARLLLVACQRAGFARAGAPVTAKLLVSVIAMPGRAQASTIREPSFILIFPGIRPA